MAIRFACSACNQPIEVDEEWASKQVACPYCRKTVTAPPESTLADLSSIPTASPLVIDSLGGPAVAYGIDPAVRPESPNHLAIVASMLVVVATVLIVLYGGVLSAHADELKPVMDQVERMSQEGRSGLGAAQEAWSDLYEEHGGVPPDWVLAAGALQVGVLLSWMAALVCSIIACRRRRRRRLAVVALVTSCLLPFFFCGLVGTTMGSSDPPATTSLVIH